MRILLSLSGRDVEMIGRPGVGLFIRLFSCRGPLARGVRAAVVGGTEFGRFLVLLLLFVLLFCALYLPSIYPASGTLVVHKRRR